MLQEGDHKIRASVETAKAESRTPIGTNRTKIGGEPELVSRPRSKNREVRVNHSIHDRLQIESNFTFDLRPSHEEEQQRSFKIDMYLFLPNSLGVNKSNFDSDEYFRHRTSYFRVRTPLYHNLRSIEPERFRLDSLEQYFVGHLSSIERERLGGKVVQDIKLFGNFLHTEFKRIGSRLHKRRRVLKTRQRKDLVEQLLHRVELLRVFRERYLTPVREQSYLMDDEVIRALILTDEYLSYRLELSLLRARRVLPNYAPRLEEILKEEMEYREDHDLITLDDKIDDKTALEAYTYRLGLLKKYLGEVLFLQLNSNKRDSYYKNLAAAIGAGLAATFAGLAEHQRVQYLTGDSGIRFALFVGVAVLAYIFKDRVKDLSKEYFNSRLKESLPDQSFALSHRSYTGRGHEKIRELGTASDYFRFLSKVPADVAYLRAVGQVATRDPERREHVVHIGRRFNFELKSKNHRRLFPLLKNVLRMDMSPFLYKLDNPTVPINFADPNVKAAKVSAPKVYHLNMVIRYEVGFGEESRLRSIDYQRIRLVLNKKGIVRLEEVIEKGRLGYEEERS